MPIELVPRQENETDREWLTRNKSLRLDANINLFQDSRRQYHVDRYQFASEFAVDKEVIDAACGTGYGSSLLGQVSRSVRGVDISQEAIDYAQGKYGTDSVRFSKCCVERTPFEDATADLIVSFETLEHTLSPRTAVFEFARLLRPDGTAIVSVPNQWGHTKNHFFDFDIPLLRSLIEPVFDRYELHYHNSGDKPHCTPKGIGPLDPDRSSAAECVLAVCHQPRKDRLPSHLEDYWVDEIYKNSFQRHREFLELYRHRGGVMARLSRSLRKRLKRFSSRDRPAS